MPRITSCLARRVNDQMVCHTCGLVWDLSDPEPPECPRAPGHVPPPASAVTVSDLSDSARQRVVRALRRAADALEEGATVRRGGFRIDVTANGDWVINSDAVIALGD